MQRNKRYDADIFLRARWAEYAARKIAIAELSGELSQQNSVSQSEAKSASPPSSLPSLGFSSLGNSGRCEGTISPAASALHFGEGE